jgi:hypothetical protein
MTENVRVTCVVHNLNISHPTNYKALSFSLQADNRSAIQENPTFYENPSVFTLLKKKSRPLIIPWARWTQSAHFCPIFEEMFQRYLVISFSLVNKNIWKATFI